eukprot:1265660-Amorphochlora_amoeboformis.AAC.1
MTNDKGNSPVVHSVISRNFQISPSSRRVTWVDVTLCHGVSGSPILPGTTRYYPVLPGTTRDYPVLPGTTGY